METVKHQAILPHVHWFGVLHDQPHTTQSFFEAKCGSTCNTYLVRSEKSVALFDVVAFRYFDDFLTLLKKNLNDDLRQIDYIILNRTDPEHSATVEKLLDLVPKIKIVGTEKAIRFLRRTTISDFDSIAVDTGSALDLGGKTLKFYYVPFHYKQEVMLSYLVEDRTLFTYDAFSAHYCPKDILVSTLSGSELTDYTASVESFYKVSFGISRSYAQKVMSLLAPLSLDVICPSHGPVINKGAEEWRQRYLDWNTNMVASSTPQIVIPYMSGNEYSEVLLSSIMQGLESTNSPLSIKKLPIDNSNYASQKENLLTIMKESQGIIFGVPTINADAPAPILDLIASMNPIVFSGKYLSAFGVYAWSGEGVRNVLSRLDQLNSLVMDGISMPFHALSQDTKGAHTFGKTFATLLIDGKVPPRRNLGIESDAGDFSPIEDTDAYIWTCGICTFRYRKETLPPPVCPACGASADLFTKDPYPSTAFQSEEPLKLVIVGNGAASITAASEARRRNARAEIVIISEESEPTYFRAELAKKLPIGIDPKQFYVRNDQWYQDKNITMMRSTRATRIDSRAKEVFIAGGGVVKYDKLIIATGSSSYVPSIRDASVKQGVFTLHHKGDMNEIREYAKKCSKALVIGSGNLGVIVALQLKRMGLDVEILEKAPRILIKSIDQKGGDLFEKGLQKMGIRLRTSCDIKAVTGQGLKATGVELEFGHQIRGDMMIFCTGVKPNTEILKGLPLKINKGLDVNEQMKTLDNNIYACGDVAEYKGSVQGLWAAAVAQGRVAGANVVGDNLVYQHTPQPIIFNMPTVNVDYPDLDIDLSLFSIGYVENINSSRENEYPSLEYIDRDNFIYHKFYFDAGHVVAAILIGDVSKAGLAFRAVTNEMSQQDFL
ncbi:MAG: FAD-dependent oxidoreductase, partial [Brevinema sp.]